MKLLVNVDKIENIYDNKHTLKHNSKQQIQSVLHVSYFYHFEAFEDSVILFHLFLLLKIPASRNRTVESCNTHKCTEDSKSFTLLALQGYAAKDTGKCKDNHFFPFFKLCHSIDFAIVQVKLRCVIVFLNTR